MIILTEEELERMSSIILKKIDRDKRFDRYTETEIATILAYGIMILGLDSQPTIEEHNDEQWEAS